MEVVAVNQILVKLLLLALNLMPVEQAGFNFHVARDGVYAATYRVERRDQDFTVFRPAAEDAAFPAFDAERSRRFGRSYTVRVLGSGEIVSVVLTDIMRDMPPLASVPRQILKAAELPAPAGGVPAVSAETQATGEKPAAGAEKGTVVLPGKQLGMPVAAGSDGKPELLPPNAGEAEAGDSSGDIRVDGVGRTLFLSMDGQELTVVAEINASL